jgi:hypothetical protein
MLEEIAPKMPGAEKSDGGDFAELFKKENSAGDDFAELFKKENNAGGDFAELFKKDNSAKGDFAELFKKDNNGEGDFAELFKKDNKGGNDFAELFGKKDSGMMEHTQDLTTRNEDLEGKNHPVTGVPFERKSTINENGDSDDGVFPVFDSTVDVQLPEDLYQASDKEQFGECNKQLKDAIENDPDLEKKFKSEQLEQIKNGDTPDGYTWHHSEEIGKMQLVDSETHAKTGHSGGKAIWGGGQENR